MNSNHRGRYKFKSNFYIEYDLEHIKYFTNCRILNKKIIIVIIGNRPKVTEDFRKCFY